MDFYTDKINSGDETVLRIIRGFSRVKNLDLTVLKLEELLPFDDEDAFTLFVTENLPDKAEELLSLF